MADGTLNHLFHPIPDLTNLPQPANKEERLQIIIANLEKQHQGVSMLAEARQRLESARTARDDSMDTDADSNGPAPADHRQFVANMNAPHSEGSSDPYLSHGTIPAADRSVKQAPVPAEVSIAQDLAAQMGAYDKHARQTRDYYVKALERQRGARGNADPTQSSKAQLEVGRDPRRRPTG
ncbi:hypothetical protein LTR53_007595 [Teratosphaeriaceae sp. CCFEE 6253]|nr:hypothetical protein LTR53_007595 [Teratosphaeriaceae sp. CCFEE 6253]